MFGQAFAQLNGINVFSYYAPLVSQQAGWKGRDAILMTGFNAIIYVLTRQQASTDPTTDYTNTLLTKQPLEKNIRNSQQPNNFVIPQSLSSNFSIEPPGIEEIVEYKNSDQHLLSSSIRRSSATVSSLVGKVFEKKKSPNGQEVDGSESVFGSDAKSLNYQGQV